MNGGVAAGARDVRLGLGVMALIDAVALIVMLVSSRHTGRVADRARHTRKAPATAPGGVQWGAPGQRFAGRKFLKLGGIVVAVLGCLAFAAPASADTYCVPDLVAGCDHQSDTIKAALDSAAASPAGDAVVIAAGRYEEGPLSYSGGGNLEVLGAGQGETILATPSQTETQHVLELSSFGSSVSGVTIELTSPQPGQGSGYGLVLSNGSSASQIEILGPEAQSAIGARVIGSTLEDSRIDLPFSGFNAGVMLSFGTIDNTRIQASEGITGPGEVRRVQMSVSQRGASIDSNSLVMENTLIDLGVNGSAGVLMLNANESDYFLHAELDHVTIVRGAPGSYGLRAVADSTLNGETSTASVENSVISGPTTPIAAEADNTESATVDVAYSAYDRGAVAEDGDIDGNNASTGTASVDEGEGIIDLVPLGPGFVDQAVANFRPKRTSPLVDGGDPAFTGTGNDLDGGDRVIDGDGDATAVTDVGAYERENVAPTVTITEVQVDGRDARVYFEVNEPAGAECRLDRGRWRRCNTGKRYGNLSRGQHTVRVRAFDLYANKGKDSAEFRIGRG